MNILISNDDGILARGLGLLGEAAGDLGRVTVVAPDREQRSEERRVGKECRL